MGTPTSANHRTAPAIAGAVFVPGAAEAALPVLGDLDAFAARDYALAGETLALYRALRDDAMAQSAMARVQALRGERDATVTPAL